ncbi:hypothetical protein WN943_005822 [Citrus x changshan-huyou]
MLFFEGVRQRPIIASTFHSGYVVLSVSSTMNLHPWWMHRSFDRVKIPIFPKSLSLWDKQLLNTALDIRANLDEKSGWYHIFVIDCSIKRAWMPQNLGCDFRSLSQHEVCCDF